MLNLVDDGVIEWNDPEVVRALRGALKYGLRRPNRQQRNGSPLKPHEIAPSARLTRSERLQITRIRVDLAQNGIRPQRWELEALARGAEVIYDMKKFVYPPCCDWPGFNDFLDLFFKCSTVYVYSIMDQLTCKGLQKLKFWNSNVLV